MCGEGGGRFAVTVLTWWYLHWAVSAEIRACFVSGGGLVKVEDLFVGCC